MDDWLHRIAADHSAGTAAAKVSRNKPPDLTDACWSPAGEKVIEPQTLSGGRCNQLYPNHADPRIAAGAPLTDDVLKCALRAINPGEYAHPMTNEQLTRLQAVFPGGVCDYSRPGVGQRQPETTWRKY
jgi:hypothetical protein